MAFGKVDHLGLPGWRGPLLGRSLVRVYLMIRGEVGQALNQAGSSLLRYLPLLLVPSAGGVMVYARAIAADFWAIVGALAIPCLLTPAFVGVPMQKLTHRHGQPEQQP